MILQFFIHQTLGLGNAFAGHLIMVKCLMRPAAAQATSKLPVKDGNAAVKAKPTLKTAKRMSLEKRPAAVKAKPTHKARKRDQYVFKDTAE